MAGCKTNFHPMMLLFDGLLKPDFVSIVQNNPYQLQYTGVGKKSITNCLWLSILRLCCQNLWNTHQNTKRRVEKVRRWTESRSARALTHHAERQGKQDWGNGKNPFQKEKGN